jgi:bifunctional non-homologous end joining protein LigD
MGLKEYHRKRNFKATPEPAGGGDAGKRIFVVQLHHASHRHFDFRLELDGVLKSWAVPKGPSFDPSVKRLAMEVEDHPLSYATFEGDIPKGNYGAGHVDVFDHGTWEPIGSAHGGLAKGDLKFTLHGDVLRGSWVLVRTRRERARNAWLLIKHQDEYAGERDANAFVDEKTDRPISLAKRKATWKGMKRAATKASPSATSTEVVASKPDLTGATAEKLEDEPFAPELCRSQSEPPGGDSWLHEVKWDGYRIVATVVGGKVRLWSRNAIEWTAKVPELAKAVASLKLKSAQLDGEMIAVQDGRDDFNALQARLSAESKAPLLYMLFDMPHLNGKSLRDVPLVERKAALAALLQKHPHALLRYSDHQIGRGEDVFAQAKSAGLEGIVSKRVDSFYRCARNGDWVKVKGRPSDEFVVIGFTEPKGSRSGIGALLLAKPTPDGLKYIGRVGTGIGDAQLKTFRKQLASTRTDEPAADISLMEKKDVRLAHWVKPTLVVEAFYQGVGGQGLLRQPAFKAVRADKTPATLAAESASVAKAAKPRRTAGTRAKAPKDSANTDHVSITHPDREVFPGTGITKGDVAAYYRAVAPCIIAEIGSRPLSVVRCPNGSGKPCFFQKHTALGWGDHVHGVDVKEKTKKEKYLCIDDEAGLLELVQMNVLEFHPWGAKSSDVEHADRIVFDLDPHPTVKWPRVVAAARNLHRQLESIGLQSFLRTSGGKGLHVVVPLNPPAPWDDVKRFAQAVAQAMAKLDPMEFVSVAGEKNREGRIFVDWLRNGRGATSVASYSLRARAAAGVAMPIEWSELGRIKSGDAFTIRNAALRVKRRKTDPWADISKVTQELPQI